MKQRLFIILALAAMAACGTPKKIDLRNHTIYRDSLVTREKISRDTVLIPDTYVVYVDTTDCPPSADTLRIIDTIRVYLPGRRIPVEIPGKDSIIYRRDTLEEVRLRKDAIYYQKKYAKEVEDNNKLRKKRVPAWLLYLTLAAIVVAGWPRKRHNR